MTATRIELSVIIPCYNAGAWVAETIRSVLAQSTPPLEIIAVNDGSTDATAEILSGFDGRVRVITQTNLGLGAARNAGARVARGEWLGFLDADDLYLPDALTRYGELHREFPEATVLFADFQEFDSAGTRFRPSASAYLADAGSIAAKSRNACLLFEPPVKVLIERNGAFTPSTLVVRKDVFFRAGQFDETRYMGAEDLDLYFRLAPTESVGFMNHVVLRKRRHAANMGQDLTLMRAAAEWTLDRAETLYREKYRGLLSIVRRKKAGLLGGWVRADLEAGRPGALALSLRLVRCSPLEPQGWWLLVKTLARRPFGT